MRSCWSPCGSDIANADCAKINFIDIKYQKYVQRRNIRSKNLVYQLYDIHHPDIHHPRHLPPQTFTTPFVKLDVHHPRHLLPQTFTIPDVHHPLCKIRRSPPQTFTTPDVHHLRRSPPQTFTTPFVKSDVHHPRHSPPPTFTTPYSKMRHSPLWHSPSPMLITPNMHHPQWVPDAKCILYISCQELGDVWWIHWYWIYYANNWGVCISYLVSVGP